MKKVDITGMRSGIVTAIEQTDLKRKGSYLWRCQCDCGKVLFLEPYKISGQKIASCGCMKNKDKIKDITGRKFGKLTALFPLKEIKGSSYMWHCVCECGNELDVRLSSLTSGNTTSCGCQRREKLRGKAKDISGKSFGLLTALEPTDRRENGSVVWKCMCKCGNTTEVPLIRLTSGNVKSCGCLKKNIHKKVQTVSKSSVLRKDNKSGYKGVCQKKNGKWMAYLMKKGRRYYLGSYDNINEAVKARKRAEKEI
ncbi:MAG: hypothetical protein IJH64_15400 [Oscillospiraceae bacterium]|nr:hypothetical protein [Oscillospiraceae bacterium]